MERMKLPETRPSITVKRVICNYKCYIIVSFREDKGFTSQPIEVFVKVAKHGSTMAGLIDGLTAVISTSLQYGVPWVSIRDKLLHHVFERNGDEAHTSILDGIAKAVDAVIETRAKIIGEHEEPPATTKEAPPYGWFGGLLVRTGHALATYEDGSVFNMVTGEWSKDGKPLKKEN